MIARLSLWLLAANVVGCDAQTVDLGANRQSAVERARFADAGVKSFLGCVTLSDTEIDALRGPGCKPLAQCSADPQDVAQSIVTVPDVVASLAGRWVFCQNDILSSSPTDPDKVEVVGLEFLPGCVTYALVRDMDGTIVRGTEAGDQGSYDVLVEPGEAPRIVLRTKFRGTFELNIASTRCPNNIVKLLDGQGRGLIMQASSDNAPSL